MSSRSCFLWPSISLIEAISIQIFLSCLGSNWVVMRRIEWTKEDLRALPKSKGEAIAEGGRYYFSGRLCKHGHLSPCLLDGKCVECRRQTDRNYHRRLVAKKRGQAEWQDGRVQNMLDLDALIESGLPTSRQEAKKSGSKYYFTGDPCRNGHLSPRYMRGDCVQCIRHRKRRTADKRRAKYREKVDRELKAKSGTPIAQG